MFERLTYDNKMYKVLSKILKTSIIEQTRLKKSYGADLILADKTHYWVLQEIIDAEFEELTGE